MVSARRALVADPDPSVSEPLQTAFVAEGFVCVLAATFDEARAHAALGELAVAVVDLAPDRGGAGGIDVLRELRASAGRPPVIVTSAVVDGELAKAAMHGGASYFLEKPVAPDQVVATAVRLLSDRSDFLAHVEVAFATTGLNERETKIGKLVLKGLSNREIAAVAGVAEKSVRSQITSIYEKCGVTSRSELFYFVFPS